MIFKKILDLGSLHFFLKKNGSTAALGDGGGGGDGRVGGHGTTALDGGSGSWFAAMDALAGAQADRDAPLAEVVLRDRSLLAGAALTLLTASTSPALAALLDRESAYVPVRVVRTAAAADGAWDALAGTNVEVAALGAASVEPAGALA